MTTQNDQSLTAQKSLKIPANPAMSRRSLLRGTALAGGAVLLSPWWSSPAGCCSPSR
jgi:hypothetical protein